MGFITIRRSIEGIFGDFAPREQVIADGVHDGLFRLPRPAQVRVMAGIEDVKSASVGKHTAGEDVQVLLAGTAPRESFAMVNKRHKVAGTQMVPGRSLAMPA